MKLDATPTPFPSDWIPPETYPDTSGLTSIVDGLFWVVLVFGIFYAVATFAFLVTGAMFFVSARQRNREAIRVGHP